jgi:hypothetical protein
MLTRSSQDTRRWAFYNIGAMMGRQNTGRLHGPWSHPHTEQAFDLLTDPYAHDRAQREAAREYFRLSMAERWRWGR